MKRWYVAAVALLAALVVVFLASIFEARILVGTTDFYTSEPTTCRPSDVYLSSTDVSHFFQVAQKVESRVIHDDYDLAPCYLKGSVIHRLEHCEWKLRPGFIGTLQCGRSFQYLVDQGKHSAAKSSSE